MRFIIQKTLNRTIINPVTAAVDIHEYMMSILRQMEGKCYGGIYIEKIIKIVELSQMMSIWNDLRGYMNISVIYQVQAMTFCEGNVIIGNKIEMISKTGIVGISSANHMVSTVAPNKALESFGKDQYLPIIIRGTPAAKRGTDSLVSTALPYLPSALPKCYIITDDGSDVKAAVQSQADKAIMIIVGDLLGEIKGFQNYLGAYANKQRIEFFMRLTYPFKIAQPMSQPVDWHKRGENNRKTIDFLTDIVKGNIRGTIANLPEDMAFIIDPLIHFTQHKMIIAPLTTPEEQKSVRTISPLMFQAMILEDLRDNLAILYDFLEIFASDDVVKRHDNLWLFFNVFKKDGKV